MSCMLKKFVREVGKPEYGEAVETRVFFEDEPAFDYLHKILKVSHGLVRRTEGHILDDCLKLAEQAVTIAKLDARAAETPIRAIRQELELFEHCGEGYYFDGGPYVCSFEIGYGDEIEFIQHGYSYKYYVKRA